MDKKTIAYLISTLREASITWSGRTECLNRNRRRFEIGKYKNGNVKYSKYEYQCKKCQQWFLLEKMEVDHIEEVGPFKGNWDEWMKRLFCDPENLQALCITCHMTKTNSYNAALRFERKQAKIQSIDDQL